MEPSLLRKMLFAIYGSLVGACYGWWAAWYFRISRPLDIAVITIVAVLFIPLAVALSATARPSTQLSLAKSPQLATWQSLVMLTLAPWVLAMGLFVLIVIIGFFICILPFVAFSSFQEERKFRRRMMEQGRYSRLKDLQHQLLQGEGTLLEETGANGVFRIWWTADVLNDAPASLSDKEFEALLFAETKDSFNGRCLDVYLDERKGVAVLTSIPPRLANNGKLTQMFPKIKRAVVIRHMQPSRRESVTLSARRDR